ncbi:hypothetical protein FOCC_FOCC016902, partial [Frankliniella occidentalis]
MFWSKDMARKECVNRTSWRDEVPAGVFDIALPEFLLDLYSEGDLTEATQRAVPVPAHWRVMVSERHRQNKNGMFKLNSNQDPDDFFYLLEKNASLLVPKYTMSIFAPGTFCLDLFVVMRNTSDGEVSVSTELSALVPFMDVEGEVAVSAIVGILYPIGLLISIPFLVATFAVYCTYSELRNLPGKSLMCYVASMIAGYLLLSLVQLNLDVDNMTCLVL